MIKKCLNCKNDFEVKIISSGRGNANVLRRNFCSTQCAHEYRKYHNINNLKKTCLNCSKVFYVPVSLKERKCCSKKCGYENRKKENRIVINCLNCKKEMIFTLKGKNIKYCSTCVRLLKRVKRLKFECKVCKKIIYKTPYYASKSKQHFCGRKCQYKAQSMGLIKLPNMGRHGYRLDLNDGNNYKSSFEADYARYLNFIGKTFQYESKTFEFKEKNNIKFYTPDFYLVNDEKFIELKGYVKGNNNQKYAKKLGIEILGMKNFYEILINENLLNEIPNIENRRKNNGLHLIIEKKQLIDINNIEEIDYEGKVVDLEIENEHNFYVSDKDVFVLTHNSKMPDIDTDFPDDKREIVRQHIIDEYGQACVAQVVAYSTMSVNMCFRDVARVFSLPLELTNEIAKQLITQHEGYKDYASVEYNIETIPALKEVYFKHEQYGAKIQEIFHIVSRLQHQVRHASIAAAASVITEKEIYNYAPLKRAKDGIAIEWDGTMISKTGLLKMDLLGIRCLKIIRETLDIMKEKGIVVDLYNWEILKDEMTLDLFKRGDTLASFQFDSHGIREMLKQMKPTSFDDIIAAAALYRPGPLSSGLVKTFCERKNNTYKETADDLKNKKFLDAFYPFIKDTYGVIVYQEQLIWIFHKVLGLNMGDADLLRRAVDEKKEDVIKSYLSKIDIKKTQLGDETTVNAAIEYLMKISGYSFNKSHSAGYSIVAFWTMYLKAHYPLEFGLITINNRIGKELPIIMKDFTERWKKAGIEVKPIDINKSKCLFDYVDSEKTVYPGFLMLNGIGESLAQRIVKAQPFSSVHDAISKKVLNKAGLDILVKIGAFDSLQKQDYGYVNRRELWFLFFTLNAKVDLENYKKDITEEDFLLLPKIKTKTKRTFDGVYQDIKALNIQEYTFKELLKFEKAFYDFYAFIHPLKDVKVKERLKAYRQKYENNKILSIEKASSDKIPHGEEVFLFGTITEVKEHISAKGNKLYFITLEDESGSTQCLIWKDVYEGFQARIKVDEKIIFAGTKSIYEKHDKKFISFMINKQYKEHDCILASRSLDNILKEMKEDEKPVEKEIEKEEEIEIETTEEFSEETFESEENNELE